MLGGQPVGFAGARCLASYYSRSSREGFACRSHEALPGAKWLDKLLP
jgi:hypothetical protein